ncbi:MAG: 50S ribosomal protein L11 methyltransferase [Candidatus Omnitrophota bacterium]
MSSKNKIYKIDLRLKQADLGKTEILRLVLKGIGIPSERLVETLQGGKTYISFYTRSRKKALSLDKKIENLGLKGVTARVESFRDADWKEKWKETYRPFKITKHILLVPMWMRNSYKTRAKKVIYLDTGLPFGTGLHFTTRTMSRFIEMKEGSFRDFLDIGTGSGILSVIAGKCGARKIWGIDIDKEAIRTTHHNLKENGYRSEYLKKVDIESFRENAAFDFVAANLDTQELLKNRDKLIKLVQPGKYLAVSGISEENYRGFRKNFDTKKLRCLKIARGDGWASVLYKKKS